MDVTTGNLADDRKFYQKEIFTKDNLCIRNVHVISLEETLVRKIQDSPLVAATISTTFDQLISTEFLKILLECDLSLIVEHPRERYKLRIGPKKDLTITLSKESYEKLGIEGQKLDRKHTFYQVRILLLEDQLQNNIKYRTKLLERGRLVFNDLAQFPTHLTCSKDGWPQFSKCLSHPTRQPQLCKIGLETRVFENVPWLNVELNPTGKIPELDAIEDLTLWAGAFCANAELLLAPPAKLDSFINTCRLPGNQSTSSIHVVDVSTNHGPILEIRICEWIRDLAAATSTPFCLTANDGRNSNGFLIYVDGSKNFVFLNCLPSTTIINSPSV